MKKITLLIFAFGILVSCRNEKGNKVEKLSPKADTLTYAYDSVKIYSKNVVKADQYLDTAKARIKYPVFKNQELNKYVQQQVFDYFAKEEHYISYEDIAKSFIKGYDSFYTENKDTPQAWFLLIDIKILKQDTNYIALQYIHSDYAGGAHGITNISYINYNPKNNQPVTLDSLIDKNQKNQLLRVAENIFRKDEKLTATESLADKYFFDKGNFSLPQSFHVSEKGLVFLYNPYEIKPYAAGTTELTIPFEALKSIAKPNTILKQ